MEKAKQSGRKVVVALTGRVDSAVAAFLLKKQGYDVIGLSIVTTNSDIVDDPQNLPKCHIKDLDGVQKLCEQIKIPFYATDIKSEYDYRVLDRLVENKLAGFANSSCFQCTNLRMETLYRKMVSLKADFIATGHYCKVYENLNTNEFFIHSNNSTEVDQSMLLSGLNQDVLKHLLLPLGELRREEVLKIAKNFNLELNPSSSQGGFCFKTKEASQKILDSKLPKSLVVEGSIINKKTDNIYGDHSGLVFHYMGESEVVTNSGMKVDKSLEVIEFNHEKNFLYLGKSEDLSFAGAQITNLVTTRSLDRRKPLACYIKFKYNDEYVPANMFFKNNDTAFLEFEKTVYPLIKAEQIVIYDSNKRNSKIIGYAFVRERGSYEQLDRLKDYRAKKGQDEEAVSHTNTNFKF